MERHILHIHIPAFPIAVARVSNPELRDRPVAVVPPHSERALLLAVSAEARREGVFKGMPLGKAIARCPDLITLPPNPDLNKKAGRGLATLAARYTPLWEPSRPGHIYLDVTGTSRLWGKAKDTAASIRAEIKSRLSLPGIVGAASNKMVSSIASRIIPTEGVLDVDPGKECSFIAPLKVDFLPGIGRARKKALLEELNISVVREIAALDIDTLKLIFAHQAYVIHQRALGIDPTPVYPPHREPVVTEELCLPEGENEDQKLLGILFKLVERCAYRLRTRALFPRKAGILIRYCDHVESRRQLKLEYLSFWDFDLYRPLQTLFFKACTRRVGVCFIRVWFWDFSPSSGQLCLFHTPLSDQKRSYRIFQALDRIREKHGEEAIRYGRVT